MSKELTLKIEFTKELLEPEQFKFWDSIIEEIEKRNLRAGGGLDSFGFDWVIDYSDSTLSKSEIIDEIGDFLMSKDNLVLNFEIK